MVLKKIDKFLASVLSLLILALQFDKSFVYAMKSMKSIDFNDIPREALQKVKYTFSIDNPKNEFKQYGAGIYFNELIEITNGKEKYHVRLLACNAPGLLCDAEISEDFKYSPKAVQPDTLHKALNGGMNIVHALANMTIDAYMEAEKHGYLAEEYSERSLKKAEEALRKLVDSEEYKPIISTVKNFVSKYDLESSVDTIKDIVVAYMIESKDAKRDSNTAKALFFGSLIASLAVGVAGAFFPPLYALYGPIFGISFSSGMKMASSNEQVARSVELAKIINYADAFYQLKDLICNRGELVGRSNVFILAFDDMIDFESKKTLAFVHTKADAFSKYKNKGAYSDFIRIRENDNELIPLIKDYKNEAGKNIFLFYKDVFHRISSIESTDDAVGIRKFLRGISNPPRLLPEKKETKKKTNDI